MHDLKKPPISQKGRFFVVVENNLSHKTGAVILFWMTVSIVSNMTRKCKYFFHNIKRICKP